MFKKTGEPMETKNPVTFQIPKKEATDNTNKDRVRGQTQHMVVIDEAAVFEANQQ